MRNPIVNGIALLVVATAAAASFAYSSVQGRSVATPPSPLRAVSAAEFAQKDDSISKLADANRTDGAASAKLWVVEISDFQCPFCKRWHEEVFPKLRDEFIKTGKIRFAYLNFPLNMHKNAFAASTAAMCASAQGKFWPMHDALFTSQEKWEGLADPNQYFEGLASKSGVNVSDWKSCLTSPAIKRRISDDRERAITAGVESTPSFSIGGKLIDGAMPWDDMKKAINAALGAK